MPRRRRVQPDPAVALQIVRDAMRGADGDPMGMLNPHERNMRRGAARMNLQIPIVDPVVMRRVFEFLIMELPALIAEMDRNKDRSKLRVAEGRLTEWNQLFAKWCGVSNAGHGVRLRKRLPAEA